MRRYVGRVGISCLQDSGTGSTGSGNGADKAGARFGSWGVETQYISPAIAPGDDFYRYVNQGWLDTAKIPAGFPLDGAFIELLLRTEKQVQHLVDEVVSHTAEPGSPAQQIADMHASYLDMERRNALGCSMLLPEVEAVLELKDHRQIARRMAMNGHMSLVSCHVDQDPGHPERYILTFAQSGLGLPGRDYYLKREKHYIGLRAAYEKYIEGVLQRAGIKGAGKKAAEILAFEKEVARRQWTPEQARDALKNYHPMPLTKLEAYAPGFDWKEFLVEAGYDEVDLVDVNTDKAIRKLAKLFSETPVDTLRAYLVFHYLNNHAELLSDEWVDAHFDMFKRRISGVREQRPLEVRVVEFLNATVGEQLGKLYVARYFPTEAKAEIDRLVKFVIEAFRERLAQVEWMDEDTRKAALVKLEAITTKIGYPDQWHDYSSIQVSRDDLVGNVRRQREWHRQDDRDKLGKPFRKWEWYMYPQKVNAYYSPTGAEIVFPAAILQAPFFDPKADPAVNFGSIGMVIGHELGHGFDDQGRRYDATGALRDWWGEESSRNFEIRTRRLVEQYNRYEPIPGLRMNGKLTLGENIGDLGGMTVAWVAYRKFVESEYHGKAPVIDGFTGDQRFFIGYAQLWRTLAADDYLRKITLTDPHSPGEFRVNGVVRNFAPWYEAFGVMPDHKLYLAQDERVAIW
ncbi:MAG: M13 family metallopeptidase [Chlorobiaceae bacterium]|nr:M13 family metallopeptidase [Chlorobiaceae bacterium]